MRANRFLCLLILSALFCLPGKTVCAEESRKIRLFILSGQSNMAYLNPDDSFTPEVKKTFPNDEVIVVRYAVGGTPIRRWWKGWKSNPPPGTAAPSEPVGDLYDTLMKQVKKALGEHQPDSVAFVWMQGERDAKEGLAGRYEEALQGLIAQVRADVKFPELGVVIGRLSDHLKGNAQWDEVRAIQEKVAGQEPHGIWVDTDALNGAKNDLHYTKEGFVELGRIFAAKAIEVISKGKQP